MHRASLSFTLPFAALLAACPPGDQDSEITAAPSGSTTNETTTPTTGDAGSTIGGSSTSGADTGTTDDATTGGDPGTTQPVDTTGLDTTGSDTTGNDTTSVDTTSVDTTSGDTTSGESSGDTGDVEPFPDTTGGELCEDGREQVDVEWSLEVPPALVGEDLTADCKLVGSLMMGPEAAVTLDCLILGAQQEVVLHYSLLPMKKVFEWEQDGKATLLYRSEPGPWLNEWLKITSPGAYFRGVHADALVPPDITIEEFYGDEVKMKAPCDPQPDACGQRQGLELRFSFNVEDFATYAAFRSGDAGNYGFPSQTLIWLERATRLLQPIGCDDVAPLWLDFASVEYNFPQ